MVNTDADNFRLMMNTLFSLYGKSEPTNEVLRVWWIKLAKYDFSIVSKSFDMWADSKTFMPTPADIIPLCKPVTPIYNAIARKADREHNKVQADKVIKMIENATRKPSRDWVKYWTDILDNPKQHKEITLMGARQALVNLGVRKA